MAEKDALAQIKAQLDPFVGKPVRIRANWGRKRVTEDNGILERTYPRVFVVILQGNHSARRVSYSYADILTQVVEVRAGEEAIRVEA